MVTGLKSQSPVYYFQNWGENMLNIDNIRNINVSDISKNTNKLTHEINEIFSARIIKLEGDNSNILLKLFNGVEIPAHMQKPLTDLPDGFSKFQVQGFKDGNIQVKLIEGQDNKNVNNNDSILKAADNLNVNEQDYPLLENMIKHNISLTKENVIQIKDILSLKDKVQTDEGEKAFIENYLNYKGVDITSNSGKDAASILNSFFKGLKAINTDGILILLENNIELSDQNIKSFMKILSEPLVIYNVLKSMSSGENLKALGNENLPNNMEMISTLDIKNAINIKTADMKNIIKNLLDNITKPEAYNNILKVLSQNMSDIKMFNSLSTQYYYLDIPMKIIDHETELKLIIKDERKNGKRLDPKNIRLIASIKTNNLGTVDAYIKIMGKNMDLKLKSEQVYVKIIDSKSIELSNALNELGYNANVIVEKKDKELDLISSNDYFEDPVNLGINVVV
jgi:hypothetical protein